MVVFVRAYGRVLSSNNLHLSFVHFSSPFK
nr:MAG TPA: hypothetical protein [Caudoviricetes sp.]